MIRKKRSILAGLAALVVVVAACQPTKPPPPPPPPPNLDADVLLVGDSVGFGVGCMLGDNGPDNQNCPPQPGFSTVNGYLGACAVAEGQILLYNRTAVEGNCNHPSADASTLWPEAVDLVTPDLVVIVTGGWEIVHRWANLPPGCNATDVFSCSAPTRQMGSANPSLNANALDNYANEMIAVIDAMRNRPSNPKVLLLNSPYVAPTAADPSGSWYEAYPLTKPLLWNSPNSATPYISSKVKIDEFNDAVADVVASINEPGDVDMFDFWVEFSPGGEFSFELCPFPDNKADPDACPGGAQPFQARLSDAGHLTGAGNTLLGEYLLPVVYDMLGIPQP